MILAQKSAKASDRDVFPLYGVYAGTEVGLATRYRECAWVLGSSASYLIDRVVHNPCTREDIAEAHEEEATSDTLLARQGPGSGHREGRDAPQGSSIQIPAPRTVRAKGWWSNSVRSFATSTWHRSFTRWIVPQLNAEVRHLCRPPNGQSWLGGGFASGELSPSSAVDGAKYNFHQIRAGSIRSGQVWRFGALQPFPVDG
jgi:hypothetical protein